MYSSDELDELKSFADESYYCGMDPNMNASRKEKVILSSKYWGAMTALNECYEHIEEDCLEILNKYVNNFEIDSIFCKQSINKDHYMNAKEAVQELIDYVINIRINCD